MELEQNIPNSEPLKVLLDRRISTTSDKNSLEQGIFAAHRVHAVLEDPNTPVVRCSVGCDAQFVPIYGQYLPQSSEIKGSFHVERGLLTMSFPLSIK